MATNRIEGRVTAIADGGRIRGVCLPALHVRRHIGRRHQPDIMPYRLKLAPFRK